MTSPASHNHEKHARLTRPGGEWGRHELAITGTTCDDCKALAMAIIQQLSSFKFAYADADHKSESTATEIESPITKGAFIEYTNKIFYSQLNIGTQPNAFQKRALFNNCNMVLVNGNHFNASKQIVVIDERKPLEKKLDKLTDVQMILVKDPATSIPGYLAQHIPNLHQIPRFSFNDIEAISRHIRQMMPPPAINGLVLSGGKSTRMGTDKGILHYHHQSQRDHVFRLLSSHCHETYISCNAEQSKHITDIPKIEDTFLGLGPLSGILSAFQHNPNTAWLTIACDLPFLNDDTITYLITHRNFSKTATAFWDAEGKFPEPLVTIWEPKAYPVLLQFLAQGYSCPRKALINSDVEMLTATDTQTFENINTPEEYREAISILQKTDSSFPLPQRAND